MAGLLLAAVPSPSPTPLSLSPRDDEAVVRALKGFHAAFEAGDASGVLAEVGPTLFIADESSAPSGNRWNAHLFLTGERLAGWPKRFLEQAGPYRNTFETVSVSIRGDAAVAVTRDTGGNRMRQWRGEESAWMLGRIDGRWRIVGWAIRDVQVPEAAAPDPDAEVRARVALLAEAFRAADAARLADLLTPGYVHANSDGSALSRAAWLTWVESRGRELSEGRFRWDSYRNVDVEVRMLGETAVVTGIHESTGARDGWPFENRLRFTQIWVREGGAWRRAAFHDSRIAPP